MDVSLSIDCSFFDCLLRSDGAATDDNPVYIFETLTDEDHGPLLDKFCVPSYFTSHRAGPHGVHGVHKPGDAADLLSVAGVDGLGFGLHRWLLMGTKNSGRQVSPIYLLRPFDVNG